MPDYPSAPRTWWTATKIASRKGLDDRRQVETADEAILVSSLCTTGLHAPCFDLDFPVEVLPSGLVVMNVPGHLTWRSDPWGALSAVLGTAGFLDPGENVNLLAPVDLLTWVDGIKAWMTPVILPLAMPPTLVPSSTEGHFHLYLEHQIPWDYYREIVRLMRECKLLQPGFANNSIARGMTMLLKPGLSKQDLAALGIEIEDSHAKPAELPEATVVKMPGDGDVHEF